MLKFAFDANLAPKRTEANLNCGKNKQLKDHGERIALEKFRQTSSDAARHRSGRFMPPTTVVVGWASLPRRKLGTGGDSAAAFATTVATRRIMLAARLPGSVFMLFKIYVNVIRT